MANTAITFEDGIEEPAPHCWECTETLPYGEAVIELYGRVYCRPCHHELTRPLTHVEKAALGLLR